MGEVVPFALPRRFKRPLPPEDLSFFGFEPDPMLAQWISDVFIEEGSPLENETYAHLREAYLGCLWTRVENSRGGRRIIGQAELMPPMAMGKWQRARAEWQMMSWFEQMPDFVITLDADYCRDADDISFCALVEHELHHCAQERDEFGAPKFTRDGDPKFAIRGHDVEEFVGVVARYGAEATGTRALVEAANRGPSIAAASVAAVCGTCAGARRHG